MTFRFIEGHREPGPSALMCDALEVSPAGYYAWRRPPAQPARSSAARPCSSLIRAIHAEVKARYGSPRIHAELAGARATTAASTPSPS